MQSPRSRTLCAILIATVYFLLAMSVNSLRHEHGGAVTIPPIWVLSTGAESLNQRFGRPDLPAAVYFVGNGAIIWGATVAEFYLHQHVVGRKADCDGEIPDLVGKVLSQQEKEMRLFVQLRALQRGLAHPPHLLNDPAGFGKFLQRAGTAAEAPSVQAHAQAIADGHKSLLTVLDTMDQQRLSRTIRGLDRFQRQQLRDIRELTLEELLARRDAEYMLNADACYQHAHPQRVDALDRMQFCEHVFQVSASKARNWRGHRGAHDDVGERHQIHACVYHKALYPLSRQCPHVTHEAQDQSVVDAIMRCIEHHGRAVANITVTRSPVGALDERKWDFPALREDLDFLLQTALGASQGP